MIFGHQADSQDGSTDAQQPAGAPVGGSFIVGAQPDNIAPTSSPSTSPVTSDDNNSQATIIQPPQVDELGLSDESELDPLASVMEPDVAPQEVQPSVVAPPVADTTSDDTDDDAPVNVPNADLLVLKQQALSDLGPLVSQLDQSPEERFRTTMMMIQSTDNQALIKEAYAAAQAITDEKIRAQALLDVVNEINYFTQLSTKD